VHTHPDNQAGLIVRDSLLRVRMRKALGGKTWETSHRTYPSDLNSSRDIWRHENRESLPLGGSSGAQRSGRFRCGKPRDDS